MPAGRIESADARDERARRGRGDRPRGASASLVVAYRDGAPVRLRDVAVVEDGLEDRRRVDRAMGEPAIGFGIKKLRGANAVQVGRDVSAKLAEIEKQLPEGLFLGHQLRHHDLHRGGDRRDPVHAGAGGAADRPRVLALPRLVVDDAQRAARDPDLDPRHLHRDVLLRLHAQHLHRARASRWWSASWSTTRSWCSRTSTATASTARARSRRPRSARARSPSPPRRPPPRSSRSSCRSPS